MLTLAPKQKPRGTILIDLQNKVRLLLDHIGPINRNVCIRFEVDAILTATFYSDQ